MAQKRVFPRSLQYLLAIAEHGSFTRAAEALHVSQPSLSQQIKRLEDTLQSPLFSRSGRTVRLTDAGEIYLHHARRAQRELDAGRRAVLDAQNLSRGSLRLGWTPVTDYMTFPLLEEFNGRYPGIVLKILQMPQDDVVVAVAEDSIDVGIAFGKPVSDQVPSDNIELDLLFEDPLCLVIGNAHPCAGQKTRMSLQEFEQESLALLNTDFALRTDIDQFCLEHEVSPHIAVESNSLHVIIEMIQVGSLATVIPESIARTQCGLYSIRLSPELPSKAIILFYRKGGYRGPAVLAFSELASDWSVRRLKETPIRKRRPCLLSEPH